MSPPARTLVVLAMLLRSHHWLLWIAAAVPLVAVGITLLVAWLAGPTSESVWEHADGPARWLPFVVGILLITWVLPTYVAFGVTRRHTVAGIGLFSGLLVTFLSLYLMAGYQVERWLFAAAGRPHQLTEDHLFTEVTQAHLVVGEYALLGAGYVVSGLLVGTGYYRFGGWRGTLLLPLAILPLFAVEQLLNAGQWIGLLPGAGWRLVDDLPTAAAAGMAAAVVAVAAGALRLLTRTVPVGARRRP